MYQWEVDGEIAETTSSPVYTFTPSQKADTSSQKVEITVTVLNESGDPIGMSKFEVELDTFLGIRLRAKVFLEGPLQ